ncbi:MAG: DUF1573 domain-containing protein [Bacteroidota bacterium]
MKTIFTCLLLFFLFSIVYAQQKSAAISFDKEVHNFGSIKEEDGPVTCKFEFTNTGSEPLIISNVKASCGCTTPDWTKTPVPPGKTGFVKATYNPQNRPGAFNKSVTVMSNAETPNVFLRIEGTVMPKPKTIADIYPHQMGDLRLKTNHIAFVKIKNNEIKTDTAEVINDGLENISINFDKIPAHITLRAEPQIIKPKEKGLIIATYDASKNKNPQGEQEWGFLIDRINVLINENNDPRNRLSISATIEEDFSKLTPEELANAPSIQFENTTFNFGTIKQGDAVTHEYKFTNTGKRNLEIRKIKASCGCTATSPADKIIGPGKTSTIKATFNSRGKSGKQNKTITVITNDPKNSSITLKITGDVEIPEVPAGNTQQ